MQHIGPIYLCLNELVLLQDKSGNRVFSIFPCQ